MKRTNSDVSPIASRVRPPTPSDTWDTRREPHAAPEKAAPPAARIAVTMTGELLARGRRVGRIASVNAIAATISANADETRPPPRLPRASPMAATPSSATPTASSRIPFSMLIAAAISDEPTRSEPVYRAIRSEWVLGIKEDVSGWGPGEEQGGNGPAPEVGLTH